MGTAESIESRVAVASCSKVLAAADVVDTNSCYAPMTNVPAHVCSNRNKATNERGPRLQCSDQVHANLTGNTTGVSR